MRESQIERYLVKRVKALGGEVRKVQWVGRRGAPDRLVMIPARCERWVAYEADNYWIELKAPGKKPTAAQLREHKRMRLCNMTVVVIDSTEGVDALLA
jgi:hypothetical protein